MPNLRLAGDPAADGLLDENPFAVLIGALLDQQIGIHNFASEHQGSLVQVGHRCASLRFDFCAAPFFLEVIPLAPLVAAWTPPVALT